MPQEVFLGCDAADTPLGIARVFSNASSGELWMQQRSDRSLLGPYRVNSRAFGQEYVNTANAVYVGVDQVDGIVWDVFSNESSAALWQEQDEYARTVYGPLAIHASAFGSA